MKLDNLLFNELMRSSAHNVRYVIPSAHNVRYVIPWAHNVSYVIPSAHNVRCVIPSAHNVRYVIPSAHNVRYVIPCLRAGSVRIIGVVSGACFLAGGVINCDLSHRRSVAVLCMLYKIRYNPMHPLCGALPVSYVPVRVTRGASIAHRYTYASLRCRTSQYRRTLFPS